MVETKENLKIHIQHWMFSHKLHLFIINTGFPKQKFNAKVCTKYVITPWFSGTLGCYISITIYFLCLVFISFLSNFSSSIFLYKNFWNLTKSIFFWRWPGAICQIPFSRDPRLFSKVAQLYFLILCTWSLVWNFQILGYPRC